MKYLSTFSGIGGFELGIQLAYERIQISLKTSPKAKQTIDAIGDLPDNTINTTQKWRQSATCIGYSEIDKYACQIYDKHFNHPNYGDITKINAKELPDFDLLVGGFPCQAFSIAGKRGGFEDTRGTMFFELARILREKQPRLFVFENVKGLLSHDQGRTFYTIITTLDELGYDCQWQVLNSKNHGVPQNRERVFIIGHLRGTPRPEVFPFGGADQEDTRNVGEDVAYTIDANYHKGTNTLSKSRRSLVLNAQTRNPDRPSLKYSSGGSGPLFKEDGAFCLPTTGGSGQYLVEPQIRRLTPVECERLQGFPDGWTEGISDTQRYKTLGNAVTVNVITDIFEKLLE